MTFGEFLTFCGYLTGGAVYFFEARRRRLATEGLLRVAVWGVLGGVLCARLAEWVLVHSNLVLAHPGAFFDPRNGGKALLGGIFGGWMAVEIGKKRLGIVRSTGDLWAPALALGEAVGRVGCYFNPCCIGLKCEAGFAVFQAGAWRHPTQLYSSFAAALIFAVLWKIRDQMPREGDLFRLYTGLYGLSRFFIEFFRERNIMSGSLSAVQWICLGAALWSAQTFWKRSFHEPAATA